MATTVKSYQDRLLAKIENFRFELDRMEEFVKLAHFDQVSFDRILLAVIKVFKISFFEFVSTSRTKELVAARMIFAYIAHQFSPTDESIGRYMKRHRTTVLHYLSQYPIRYKLEPSFKQLADQVRDDIDL